MSLRILALALAATFLALVPPGAAQTEDEGALVRIEVTVTAVSGRDVYLDRGRAEGLAPGDEVRLFPAVGSALTAVLRSVSTSGSRAQLRSGDVPPDIGTRGEILVPRDRLADEQAPPDAGPDAAHEEPPTRPETEPAAPPPHPPWERAPEQWDQGVPLLAPITARAPEERAWQAHGRWYSSLDVTWDSGQVDQSFTNVRTGLDLGIENPFRRAGELDIRGNVFSRLVDSEGTNDTETEVALDRLSYSFGGLRGQPNRYEIGRFLHHEFPEFGLHDGVDFMHRFGSGSRAGASLGYLPEPSDSLPTGRDLGFDLYYRYVADESENLAMGLGYQKTWHEGKADRDLVVGNLNWVPSSRARVFASAWADYYTGSDDLKDPGFELTQLQVNGNLRWDAFGVGLFASQIRFPQLLRNEFNDTNAQELARQRVRRIGLSSWYAQSPTVRWDARVNAWEDDEDTGGGGDLRVTLRNLLWDRGACSAGVFSNTGNFSSGQGLRLSASRNTDLGAFRLAYDVTDFQQDDGTVNGDILQQAVTANYDRSIGESWDLSVFSQVMARDGDHSTTLGITLSKRF